LKNIRYEVVGILITGEIRGGEVCPPSMWYHVKTGREILEATIFTKQGPIEIEVCCKGWAAKTPEEFSKVEPLTKYYMFQ